jgi:cell division inhibitor SepF
MSFWKKTAVYLGLVDEDEDAYEYELDDEPPRRAVATEPEPTGTIRTIPRGDVGVEPITSAVSVQPRPAVVRPIVPIPSARVHVVAPSGFPDAKEIGDKLKASQPVIVNLQGVDRDLCRRVIDFASGLAYGLGGQMEKVAEQVFLLAPANVDISAEEKRRLQERGLYRA